MPVADDDAANTADEKSDATSLSPELKTAAVLTVAVQVAEEPPPPVIVTLGVVVYPEPLVVTLIPIIVCAYAPPVPTTAMAWAPLPPPPVIFTVGVEVYPVPALVTVIPWTFWVTPPPVRYLTHIVSGLPVVASTAEVLTTLAVVPVWLPIINLPCKLADVIATPL